LDNFRRNDYFVPRTLREAFGRDDTFEPEIRCISESWGFKPKRSELPFVLVIAAVVVVICQVIKLY